MKDYQKLKEVICQSNPEIMELKFGCETSRGTYIGRTENDEFYFTGKKDVDGDREVYYLEDIEGVKKYGRPIRLADVLLAIGKNVKIENGSNGKAEMISIDEIGDFGKFSIDLEGNIEGKVFARWDLADDNLDNQSEETKQFLIDLLIK